MSLGLGDLNGQPQDDTRVTGDAILAQAPVVNLVAGQTRAIGVQGDMTQEIRATSEFNQFGQLVRSVDPELNVHTVSYYPEADPDGDGVPVVDNMSTLLTGGYPSSAAADTQLGLGRNSGSNPAPTLITSSQRYDPVGNVIEATDPRGIVHAFRVNALNQVVGSTIAADTALLHPSEPGAVAALGYETVVIYDANNNVVETRVENAGERSGDGVRVGSNPYWAAKVAYDILNNPVLSLAEVEPVANDVALSVSSPGVIVSRVAYDKNENVQLVTKPEGNQLAYLYDERQLPYQVIDGFGSPEAGVYTFTYNANGSMVYAVDAEKNNPAKDPGVPGDVTRVHIDGFDETFCVVDAESNFGLSVFDPTGARVRYVRFGPNEEGNPRLSEVELLHDELGRRFQTEARIFETQVTGGAAVMDFSIPVIGGSVPAGESEAIHLSEFDRLGRVIRGIDAKGDEALLDWDGASRLLRAQGPLFASRAGTGATRNEVSYAYNQASQVVRVLQTDRSPVQADETFEYLRVYDAVGRLVRSTDPVGHTSRLVYDSRSNVIAASDAQSSVLTGDPLGLFAGQINGHGNVVQVRYDGVSRPVQSDLALKVGGVGNGSLDLLGWTGLDTSNPANADGLITKRMRYDRNSRLLSQTDDNGNTTGSIYDARDRVTHSVAADLTARQVVYDRDSMVRRSIDRNGTVVSRTYDGIGRLMTAEVTKQATGLEGLAQNVEGTTLQAWEYDGLSRLRVAFDNNGPGADDVACSYTWDSLSRKTSERHRFNVLGGLTGASTTSGRVSVTPTGATLDRTVASQYDVDSNRVGLTYSSGRQLTFGIDGADRLQEISDGGGVIAGWEFVGGRPVVCGLRNGVQTNFGYDAKRRVTSIDHVGVVAFGYGWDRANRRTFETQSPGRTETYGYDSAYRVTSVGFSDGTPTTSYQIDGVGNWVTRVEGGETTEFNRRTNGSHAYDVMNEQFRLATFDQAGSLVAESSPVSDPNGNRIHDGEKKLVFDAFDRLLRVEEVGGSTVATYRYDVAGRRTQKTTSSEDTYYVSDGAREIEELAANGAVQADYVFGGYVDHVVQMRRGGGEYYLHQDSTFSVAAVTNAAGTVVTRYAYGSIYGTSSISAGSDVGNPWRFQGRRWDAESGFYQFRARYLDPALGRFVSRDPLGLWGDASNVGNGYTFCGNDPVNAVDPFGLEDGQIDWDRLIGSSYALFVVSLNPATSAWGTVGVVFANNTEAGQGVLRGGGRAIREPCEAAVGAWWTGVKERASAFWEGTTTAGPLYGLYMSTWTGLKQTVSGAIDGVTSIPEQFTSTGSAFGDAYEAYLTGDYEAMAYSFGRAWLGSGMLVAQGLGLGSFLRGIFGRIRNLWSGSSGRQGNPHCFVAGTLVETRAGRRPIEEVKPGDEVLSQDEQSGEQGYKRVLKTFRATTDRVVLISLARQVTPKFESGEGPLVEITGSRQADEGSNSGHHAAAQTLRCSPPHPFWVVGRGWVTAEALQPGDLLVSETGESLVVVAHEIRDYRTDVFNLHVAEWNTYFVAEAHDTPFVWVHNKARLDPEMELLADGTLVRGRTFGLGDMFFPIKRLKKKVRKHIHQVRTRYGTREDIPKPDAGGIQRVEEIIRARVAEGGGVRTRYAGEEAVIYPDGGASYVFKPSGEFWTILGN